VVRVLATLEIFFSLAIAPFECIGDLAQEKKILAVKLADTVILTSLSEISMVMLSMVKPGSLLSITLSL
jgi:hypothetical protein